MPATWNFVLPFCIWLAYAAGESQSELQTFTLVGHPMIPKFRLSSNLSEPQYYKAKGRVLTGYGNNDNAFYTICAQTEATKHVCNFTRLTYVSDNITIENNCLNIQLTSSTMGILVVPMFTNRIAIQLWKPTGDDKGVTPDYNEPSNAIGFLNFDNCNVFDLDYTDDVYPAIFIDRVDAFMNSPEVCGNLESCRVSYDYNGKLIGEPVPFPRWPKMEILAADFWSPDKGYFVTLRNGSSLTTMHVDADGKAKTLFEEGYTKIANELFPVSRVHDLHSNCYRLDDRIRCQQMNTSKLLLNRTLDNIPWTSDSNLLGVRSLAEGVILLAVVDCDRECTSFRLRIVRSEQTELDNNSWLVIRGIHFGLVNSLELMESDDRYCLVLSFDDLTLLGYRKWCVPKRYVAALDATSTGKSPNNLK